MPSAEAVAPGLADLGVMLAYSPVHHLLFDRLGGYSAGDDLGQSGRVADRLPREDLNWIDGLADAVLSHDRPIGVPCEDSVITIDDQGNGVAAAAIARDMRRCRSRWPPSGGEVLLATGGDLKTTFALMAGARRTTPGAPVRASWGYGRSANPELLHLGAGPPVVHDRSAPDVIVCDMHPGYATTAWARRGRDGRPVLAVQHHHAHAVSLLAEHERLDTPIIAVAYDGTGYGLDGTVWGGELLAVSDPAEFTRVGHLAAIRAARGRGSGAPTRLASPWTC